MNATVVLSAITAVLVTVGCVSVGNAKGEMRVTATPVDDIDWTVLPDGRAIATVHGDRQNGEHTTFVRFPAGLRTAVHTHSNTYDGIIVRGTARHYEPRLEESAKWLSVGSVYHVPAYAPHISECSDESNCIFAIHQHGAFDRAVVE